MTEYRAFALVCCNCMRSDETVIQPACGDYWDDGAEIYCRRCDIVADDNGMITVDEPEPERTREGYTAPNSRETRLPRDCRQLRDYFTRTAGRALRDNKITIDVFSAFKASALLDTEGRYS